MTANLKLTEEKTWRGNKGLDKTRESDVSKGHEEERRRRWGEEIGDGERERRGSEEGVVREEGGEVVGVGVGEMEGERGEGGAEEMEPSFGDGGDGGGGGGGGWEIMRGEMTLIDRDVNDNYSSAYDTLSLYTKVSQVATAYRHLITFIPGYHARGH
ncbi:hypothetical protein Tco_1319185 [Tanacetum coccineum]